MDVVGAGLVVVVGGAQETVAIGQDLEDSLGKEISYSSFGLSMGTPF